MDWRKLSVLVTGGASFIGSHLVDALVGLGPGLRVVDDLTSGRIENLKHHIDTSRVEFIKGDLRESGIAKGVLAGIDIVFHLAADHGGRGYVDLRQADTASNLLLDGMVFREALKAGVKKIIFASSGCVYPNYLQTDVSKKVYLTEDIVRPPYDADNIYGWAKLMGELTLRAYYKEHGLRSVSCRYFSTYGPRGLENHAVMAIIARAFIGQDPFEVWGDGTQVRNWTYVDDIVRGTVLAAERIDDGRAVNLGTMERISVIDAVKMVMKSAGHKARVKLCPGMPTGPLNRIADNSLAKKLLGWEPETLFSDGLEKTIEWYFSNKKKTEIIKRLGSILISRNTVSKEKPLEDSGMKGYSQFPFDQVRI